MPNLCWGARTLDDYPDLYLYRTVKDFETPSEFSTKANSITNICEGQPYFVAHACRGVEIASTNLSMATNNVLTRALPNRDHGPAAPHGPNVGGQHAASAKPEPMNPNEKAIFNHLILPDDSYDETGTYWADMPLAKRWKFVSDVDSQEAKRELGIIAKMFKRDALSPFGAYLKNTVVPGAGLLLEGYVTPTTEHRW